MHFSYGTVLEVIQQHEIFMKKSPHDVQTKGGWGVKGLLNNVKKNCTFLKGGHPLHKRTKTDTQMSRQKNESKGKQPKQTNQEINLFKVYEESHPKKDSNE